MLHHRAQSRLLTARRVVALAAAAVLTIGGTAVADDVVNDLDTSLDATAESMSLNVGGANGTTKLSLVNRNGDGNQGCNIQGSEALVVSPSSSEPGVATVSIDNGSFGACSDERILTVRPVEIGTTTITLAEVSNNTGGTYNYAPAIFTVHVGPRANTPPVVTVTDVTDGATYEKSAVPQPGCAVVDAEDAAESATPQISNGAYDALGQHTVTCSYTDGGQVTRSASATYTVVRDTDTSAPVVDYALDPAVPSGDNGWYTGDVSLTWTVTEGQSSETLTRTGCVDQEILADQAATTYSCSATSEGGTSSSSVTLKRDSQAPEAPTASLSPIPNGAGWNNGNVVVHFAGNGDNGPSGVDTCTADVPVNTEGEDQVVSGTCTDEAGNESAATEVLVDLDRTAPVISNVVTVDGTVGANGWYTSDVTVTFTATDNLSGFGPGGDSKSVTSSGEGDAVEVTSPAFTDRAGNTTTPAGAVVKTYQIDKSAPDAPRYSIDPAPNGAGWNNTDVTVSFAPDGDDNGPSGIDSCTADVTIDTDGANQTVDGTCTDNAGNVSDPTTVTINRDTQAPNKPTYNLTPAPNTAGWNNTDVVVDFIPAGDNGPSGVASCTADVTVNADGVNQAVTGTCTDAAGNVSDTITATVNRDTGLPSVAFDGGPSDGESYYFGSVPDAPRCIASDSLSGIAGACTVRGYGTAVGTHVIDVEATDRAGNTRTVSRTYHVLAWTGSGFYQPVDMGGVLNKVKGGSTVPLKFELFAGSTELTDIAATKSFKYGPITCSASAPVDAIEVVTTGGTSLRYDSTGGQFVQNWKIPTATGCYSATMTAQDGTTIWAKFQVVK
jgi:hypothetical protein